MMDYKAIQAIVLQRFALVRRWYVTNDETAAQIAERLNVEHNQNLASILFRLFGPKGKGHGGSRKGAGRPKKNSSN